MPEPVSPVQPGIARTPDYTGRGLLNLVAEIERRMTGRAEAPGLFPELAALIPEAATMVLVLIDGLGDIQLDHPAAEPLRRHRCGRIDAPFPTTTTVSMSTIATGTSPTQHGVVGHLLW
ncbi:MAG: alkaline phosphatase family protein, partial [Acidimicrobiia bacterium]